jgi:hypothetical protein
MFSWFPTREVNLMCRHTELQISTFKFHLKVSMVFCSLFSVGSIKTRSPYKVSFCGCICSASTCLLDPAKVVATNFPFIPSFFPFLTYFTQPRGRAKIQAAADFSHRRLMALNARCNTQNGTRTGFHPRAVISAVKYQSPKALKLHQKLVQQATSRYGPVTPQC